MKLKYVNSRCYKFFPIVISVLLFCASSVHAVVFQAEDYSLFFDTTPENIGGAYRADAVDIQATSDVGGGFNVGWIEQSEWLVYQNLQIPASGQYKIRMRVASLHGATASVDLNGGAILLGKVAIASTGGWQNWQTVEISAHINAGTYNLGVYAQTSGWNFNWIEVVAAGGNTQGTVVVSEHANYTGWSVGLNEGSYNLSALQARGFVNDNASSLQVQPGFEAVLFEHHDFTGASIVVSANESNLKNRSFNDITSSIIVRRATPGNLAWADEFNSIDFNNWTFEVGGGGWGNNELQYYTNGQNASIQYDSAAGSNVLVIEARQENPANYNCWYGACTYTSTRLISRDKRSFKYGRIEARIKLPQTQGIWPAFWALGNAFATQGWPQGGEIDIMEHVGFEPTLTHGALHGPGYSGNTPISGTYDVGERVDANYHIYAIEWDTNQIRWYVDDNHFYTATRAQVEQYGQWVYDQPFWLLLNVAVGGNWPGYPDGSSRFPQRMYVDYVRVYQ